MHVAIQGLGSVGENLAEQLASAGAKLSVSDINTEKVTAVCDRLGATAVAPDKIISLKCDVLAPCALGEVINAKSLDQFNCKIIAGSANNQLSREDWAKACIPRHPVCS